MKNDKTLSLLGICRRAGKLVTGFDAAVISVTEKKSFAVLAASDISEKTFKNLKYEVDKEGVTAVKIPFSMEEVGRACGIKAGIVSVCDEGFAKAVLKTVSDIDKEKEDLCI